MRKGTLVALVGLAALATAGLAAAAYAGQSVWGDANPGEGANHAAMPAAGLDHNQAGAEHPPEFAGQPDDVPPEDAGMPDALPDEASDEADSHYPPDLPEH